MATFIQPIGNAPCDIMLIGDVPSKRDLENGYALSGYSALDFSRAMLEAGLPRSKCFCTSALSTRPLSGDIEEYIAFKKKDRRADYVMFKGKWVNSLIVQNYNRLLTEISLCQPKVIITLGNLPLWLLTGHWGITSWRGSILSPDCKLDCIEQPIIIPTHSPQMLVKQYSVRPYVIMDIRRAKKALEKRPEPPKYNFIVRPDYTTTLEFLAECMNHENIAVDIETRMGHIACIGVAYDRTNALCIPLLSVERPTGYWAEQEEATIFIALRELLISKNIIGQNFQFDAQYIFKYLGVVPRLAWDTMIAQHTMASNQPKSLDVLSSLYCDYHQYWKEEGREWDASIPEEQYWTYNCKDCVITYEIAEKQKEAVKSMGLEKVNNFQQRLWYPVLYSMLKGVRVDKYLHGNFDNRIERAMAENQNYINEAVGHPLNISSSPQMKHLFYEDLGMKPVVNKKSGTISCNDESLHLLAEKEILLQPLVNRISLLRSLKVFKNTFINAPLGYDGRMRCSFKITGTETYRFASSKDVFGSGMNLQNIPKGDSNLPNIRKLFIPDEDKEFFDIDLSSADLRVVVWEADEPEFKAMLRAGEDPYTIIAREFYHDPSITKKDPRRQKFKSLAHGTNYMGTAKSLAQRLGLSVREAETTQQWYFGRFPRIKQWQDRVRHQVSSKRMVENVFGYRCYFFDRIEGNVFNQAAAWIPQSTVACIINRAYLNIFHNLPEVEILLQVHDSLAGQYDIDRAEYYREQIIKYATITLPYDDPMAIPVGIKTSAESWGGCE